MDPTSTLVLLSRVQFGFTAMIHFIFVPLTLGLTWMLFAMETCYIATNKPVYRDMTMFWAKLLAINFAMGVITGITLEFEFGTNWAYFSDIIGGSFGPVLAIEGITAFMLEATMFGLFFFGWNRLGKKTHWIVTFFMAVGATLSIVNILAANSWMQDPHGTFFDPSKMALHLSSLADLYLAPLAQIRIGHVAYAGYVTASVFVLGISAFYLLRGRDTDFAKRSMAMAISFGFIAIIMSGIFGDENGLTVAKNEPEKMAAIEGQWVTQKPPAAWYVWAIPHQAKEMNTQVFAIPYALSLITSHSLKGTVTGLKEIMHGYQKNFADGLLAYNALHKIRTGHSTPQIQADFKKYSPQNLGFAFLLEKYTKNPLKATPAQLKAATKDTIPDVATAFFTFRLMILMWGIVLLVILFGVYYLWRNTLQQHRWFLRFCLWIIPAPYIAAESGWVLAEVGRQPWTVHYMLPTFISTSSISSTTVAVSLAGFVIFYFSLFAIELFLMFKYARLGPSSLGTGQYHFEKK